MLENNQILNEYEQALNIILYQIHTVRQSRPGAESEAVIQKLIKHVIPMLAEVKNTGVEEVQRDMSLMLRTMPLGGYA